MPEFLRRLFDPTLYMPHGACYLWQPSLVLLHAVSDSIITLAYYAIPVLLVMLVRKRRDIPFDGMILMFAIFIMGCGTTHLMEVWTLWKPYYWLSGIAKLVTAAASIATAALLVPLLPKLVALPSPKQLAAANQKLVEEIARREQAEAAILRTSKLESIGTLAGGVAHDFNNLLNIVSAHSAILERATSAGEPAPERNLRAIQRAVERGAALVRQLTMFARARSEPQPTHVNDLLLELAGMVRQTFSSKVILDLKLDGDCPSIHADPTQLHQAVLNLCLNASEAMPEGGRLTLATSALGRAAVALRFPAAAADRYVRIDVVDTGLGMDAATKKSIFEPFFTTKPPNRGAGLGLAVTYGVMQAHGGFVDVESEQGEGTSFRLYLPAGTAGTPGKAADGGPSDAGLPSR